MKSTISVLLFAVLLLATACQTGGGFAADAARPGRSERYAADPKGETVSLDDVTNGLVDKGWGSEARELAGFDASKSSDLAVNYGKGQGGQQQAPPPSTERMLIQTGRIRVEVPRAEQAGAAFLSQVEQWGGYLQRQSDTSWTVRVPTKHFDDALAAAREAGRVLAESREANDVTEEFVDLGIRVDNARRSRDRLLEILAKAEKVEEILAVERELRRLTEEIERMEGRLKFLRDQVAMSTLTAEFVAVAEPQTDPQPRRRQMSRFVWINQVGPKALSEGF